MSSSQASVQTSLSQSAPPTSSSDTVSLHDLCDECTNLCRSWEVLDWLQRTTQETDPTRSKVKHCTVAHLQANQHACHLCSFLLGSLIRSKRAFLGREDQLKIFFHLHEDKDSFHKGYTVRAELAEQVPTEDSTSIPFDGFLLKTFEHTETSAFDQHIVATTVPRLAHNNLERARRWIETCHSNHTTCRQFHHDTVDQDRQRPTRILEVSPDSVKLRDSMSDKDFEYLVLSHMWGTPSPSSTHDSILQLNLANVHEFCTLQQDIPWDKLSPIYREAIRATTALGYKYLWIDSLCIIQDSSADWEYEARRMASVYGNAACNLAFLFPDEQIADGKGYTRDDPRVWSPCTLRPATRSKSGIAMHHQPTDLRTTYHSHTPQDWLVQRDWPLFDRAWTFQEYLLSPRTLLLGHRNLMWHCSDGFYDELLGPIAEAETKWCDAVPKKGRDMGKSRYFPETLAFGLGKSEEMSDTKILSFMKDWQALINEYRSRKLTQAKDRVIAFAGIARAFTHLGKLRYLAGCWAELFPVSLLWYVHRKINETVRRENPTIRNGDEIEFKIEVREEVTQQVPSFSQFSVPIYTYHQTYFLLNEDEVYVKGKSYVDKPRVYWDDVYWTSLSDFRFGDHAADTFPESGYWDSSDLRVTLDMPILPVSASWPLEIGKQFSRIRSNSKLDADLCWEPVFTYYPDTPVSPQVKKEPLPPRKAVLAMVTEFQICRLGGKYGVQRQFAGLAVVRGKDVGTWKRVGAWKLRIKISGVRVDEENLAEVVRRWKTYDIVGDEWRLERITLI